MKRFKNWSDADIKRSIIVNIVITTILILSVKLMTTTIAVAILGAITIAYVIGIGFRAVELINRSELNKAYRYDEITVAESREIKKDIINDIIN